ncbi:hypothetical protein QTI17_34910, partial [Variovorax sp. J31P179]|uniref:hypothetical protein n=1 Tax=Variovorax sp. J31P179 TaxID=3053508 RepID=UPI002575E007
RPAHHHPTPGVEPAATHRHSLKGATIMNDLETRTPGASSSTKKDTSSYGPAAPTPAGPKG